MDGMASEGWMTQAEREKATFPKTVKYNPNKGKGGPNGYLVTEVKKELETKVKLSGADIDRGGYKVVTTINKSAQAAAVEAVKDRMPEGEAGKGLRVGTDQHQARRWRRRGHVRRLRLAEGQFNAATEAKLQAGSTFKVFTLMAALQEEISTKSRYDGSSPQYFEEFKGEGNATGKVDQLRLPELRPHRPAHGHGQLGQHRLRRAQHPGRPQEDQGCRDRRRPAR